MPLPRLHILHIGKTGGSALAYALRPLRSSHGIVLHAHPFTLSDVPEGAGVAFIVRDPVRRFVSGFNSRLRKGLPHGFVEWTEAESIAFARFSTPTALGEALGSNDEDTRASAIDAMQSIYHPARKLSFWLRSVEYIEQRRRDIKLIALTDELDQDFAALSRLRDLPSDAALPNDPVARHATPPGFQRELSGAAEAAIRRWYDDDYPILDACLRMRADILRASGTNRLASSPV